MPSGLSLGFGPLAIPIPASAASHAPVLLGVVAISIKPGKGSALDKANRSLSGHLVLGCNLLALVGLVLELDDFPSVLSLLEKVPKLLLYPELDLLLDDVSTGVLGLSCVAFVVGELERGGVEFG